MESANLGGLVLTLVFTSGVIGPRRACDPGCAESHGARRRAHSGRGLDTARDTERHDRMSSNGAGAAPMEDRLAVRRVLLALPLEQQRAAVTLCLVCGFSHMVRAFGRRLYS